MACSISTERTGVLRKTSDNRHRRRNNQSQNGAHTRERKQNNHSAEKRFESPHYFNLGE